MVDLRKSKSKINKILVLIYIVILIVSLYNVKTYCFWYEEPIIEETMQQKDFWWLSKKKQQEAIIKEKLANEQMIKNSKKKTKWIYDSNDYNKFPKNKWEIIDEDNDQVGYNYFFDKDGYLLKDTLTPDYRVVDSKGREVDFDIRPIQYKMNKSINDENFKTEIVLDKADSYIPETIESAKVIIGVGVVLKEKVKIYDNSINKDVKDYIEASNRFIKNTKGTTNNKVKWKECSSIKNEGYIIITNPKNNFNKISAWISNEYVTGNDAMKSTINVYDADEYDKYNERHILYDLEPIYTYSGFNNIGIDMMSFTFNRSIKRLRMELCIEGEEKITRNTYIKDMKFGFSKRAYINELEEKKDKEEEIEELKKLGIYVDDYYSLIALDEEGNEIEEAEEIEEDDSLYDEKDGYRYNGNEDETDSYEDIVRDRNSGPAFDESLQDGHTWRDSGPAFIKDSYK